MQKLGKEDREAAIRSLQEHFRAERGEAIGDLAAGFLLDAIERDVAPLYYNQGVRAAKAAALRTLAALDEDLDALLVLPRRTTRKAA